MATSRLIRRQRIVIAVAVTAAVVSLGGMAASTLVKSPAQRAAEQGPPPASLLTASVQRIVLRTVVVVRGTVAPVGSVSVTPTTTATAAVAVVTATPKSAGARVAPGDVVAQVSGRPIFALPGSLPVYRDLKPSTTGPDVAQLQAALHRLGYPDADPAGTYGPGTKRAVRDFYTDRGFDPQTIDSIDGLGSLLDARTALTQARRKLTVDRAAVAAATDAATHAAAGQQVVFDQEDVATAAGTLAAVTARTGVQVPMSELVFVPSLPATIGSLNAPVGTILTGSSTPLLTINIGRLAVQATVPPGQQQLIKPGLRVSIDDDVNQRSAAGTVTTLGRYRAGGDPAGGAGDQGTAGGGRPTGLPSVDADTPGYPMLVTPTGSLPSSWLGADVRLTVIAAATRGPVLVVPAAAVSSSADGTTSVLVLTGDGVQRRIAVRVGAVAHGQVEVTPAGDAVLAAGDLVVVGQ